MAQIKIDFFREIYNKINSKEITLLKGVELVNEEVKRQPTADELGIFNRKECVFKFCPNEHLCQEKCINS